MGRSKSAWKFSAERSANETQHHPFAGLPLEWVGQLIEPGIEVLGNKGTLGTFDHFMQFAGPLTEASAGGYTLSGATGTATITTPNTPGGEIVMTADATGGCNPTLQIGSATGPAPYLYLAPTSTVLTKQMWAFVRCKLLTVASMEMFFGVATPDTAPCTSDTFPSDGIFFHKASSDTNMSFQVRKDGTGTTKTAVFSSAMADATYFTMGFRVLPNGTIIPYYNGAAMLSSAIAAGTANLPVAGDVMQPMIGFKGASMTLTLDWLLFCQEI